MKKLKYQTKTLCYCKDCNKIISYNAGHSGKSRCKDCNYKYRHENAVTLKDYFCELCGTKICYYTFLYGNKVCKSCAMTRAASKIYPLKYRDSTGYIYVRIRNHPYTTKSGYIYEHRLVMEKFLGRYLKKYEIIHHLNGVRNDNRIENLALTDSSKHEKHTLELILKKRIKELEGQINDK